MFIPTPTPEPRPQFIKHPRNRRHQDRAKSQYTRRPAHPHRLVEMQRKQWERRREGIPCQARRAGSRRAIFRAVCVHHEEVAGYVDEDRAEDGDPLEGDGDDPVNGGAGGPREEKEPRGEDQGADHGAVEAGFGGEGEH